MKQEVVIGTRGSDLAMWQANFVKDKLEGLGVKVSLKVIKTYGDQDQKSPFSAMSGTGFFTKAIEDALINEEVDLAVHSHKDLETTPTPGLVISAVPERYSPSDLLIIRPGKEAPHQPFHLPIGALVGTSSPRRRSQLLAFRPDLEVDELRGNVPTRLQKLRDGKYDAILLADAGVKRLELSLSEFSTFPLDPVQFIPAPAQGALALQIREGDAELAETLKPLHVANDHGRVWVEREILRLFRGGCQLPIGVHCQKFGDTYRVWATIAKDATDFPKRTCLDASSKDVGQLPQRMVDQLNKDSRKSVLITRKLDQGDYLFRALTHHQDQVLCQSLIDIQPLEISPSSLETDWIFFTSRNGVRYFFDQAPDYPEDTKFGTIGPGTASFLQQEIGIQADFIGEGGDTSAIADQFAKLAKGMKVTLPCSKRSAGTVQKALQGKAESKELHVYDTLEKEGLEIPDTQVVIFTSPSNVRAYLKNRLLAEEQDIIAIGQTTSSELSKQGIDEHIISTEPTSLALTDAFFSI